MALYAVQSLLLCLRWGYGFTQVGPVIAALAPVLRVCAYLAYLTLTERWSAKWQGLAGVVAAN